MNEQEKVEREEEKNTRGLDLERGVVARSGELDVRKAK